MIIMRFPKLQWLLRKELPWQFPYQQCRPPLSRCRAQRRSPGRPARISDTAWTRIQHCQPSPVITLDIARYSKLGTLICSSQHCLGRESETIVMQCTAASVFPVVTGAQRNVEYPSLLPLFTSRVKSTHGRCNVKLQLVLRLRQNR